MTVAMILALMLKTSPVGIQAEGADYEEPEVEAEYVPEPELEPDLYPEEEVEEVEDEPEVEYEVIYEPVEDEATYEEVELQSEGCEELLGLITEFNELIEELTYLREQISNTVDSLNRICRYEMSSQQEQYLLEALEILEAELENIELQIETLEEMRDFLLEGFNAGADIDDLKAFIEDILDQVLTWEEFWAFWDESFVESWLVVEYFQDVEEAAEIFRNQLHDRYGYCVPGCPCPAIGPPAPPPPPPLPDDPPVDRPDEPPAGGGQPTPAPGPAVTAPQTGDVAPASTPLLGVMLSLFLISGGTLLRKRND
jgi:hypothetical protein